MTVESIKHESAVEARDHFFEKLEEATLTGRWMAVVWKIEDGQIRVGSCTKHNFPDDDFHKALELLKEHSPLKELPDTPLPSADEPPVIQFAPAGEQVEDQAERIVEAIGTIHPGDTSKQETPSEPNPGDTQS